LSASLGEVRSAWPKVDPGSSLASLLGTSSVGVAICDKRLRFQAINDTLASMNGLPAEAHIDKTIYQMLGNAATKVEPAFQHVFVTGEPLSNYQVIAQLPTRTETGHWIENYYPIKNGSGKVLQVVAIVLEVTKRKSIEQSLCRLANKLHQAEEALKKGRGISHQVNHQSEERSELWVGVEHCISETRLILELLRPALHLAAVRHHQATVHPKLERITSREKRLAPHDLPAQISDLRADRLSSRELQVVQLLAGGKSNREMAAILNISIRTVETYRARVMLKLDLHSIAELVRYAIRNNII